MLEVNVPASVHAGGRIVVSITSDSPLTVEIRCFTRKPPPPGFKGCPECGSFDVAQGSRDMVVTADAAVFRSGGELHISALNRRLERREVVVNVEPPQEVSDDIFHTPKIPVQPTITA